MGIQRPLIDYTEICGQLHTPCFLIYFVQLEATKLRLVTTVKGFFCFSFLYLVPSQVEVTLTSLGN